ncbi:MAG: hypothetical protein GWM98_04890 [Nitrospinaceae bacterium]|nr:PD-(D/E)XK nuclease family protein [Deltaproteobacteria bacterium]NIY14257.1 hypothetical protein [Nitrospinaceae bacterium]
MNVSPSRVSKFRRCRRLIGFEYVEKIKPPPSPKQQFGKDVHAQLERWFKSGKVPDRTSAGLTAKQGIKKGWLPGPNVPGLLVEHEAILDWSPGVRLKMFPDLVVPPLNNSPRIVVDHKTTSDLRYAMTPEQVAADEQAAMYAAWAMLTFGEPEILARWIYYSATNPKKGPRKPNGVKKAEARFRADSVDFLGIIEGLQADIGFIVEIIKSGIRGLNLDPSPESCEMFGGCFFKDRCQLSPADRLVAYTLKKQHGSIKGKNI